MAMVAKQGWHIMMKSYTFVARVLKQSISPVLLFLKLILEIVLTMPGEAYGKLGMF